MTVTLFGGLVCRDYYGKYVIERKCVMINPNSFCPGCMNEKVTEGKCPICGYNPEEPINPIFLRPNSLLEDRYIIGKPIDSNGEGVTYLGYDTATSATVNIREFFPTGLCERDVDGVSVVMASGYEFNYNDALLKFVDLSKELFKLNGVPALYDVLDVREANGTAYRITRCVPGISLREFLMRNGGVLKWDQARSLFAPLVASISAFHKAGIVHRGISPDTLIVGKDGKLRITGFCIAEERIARSPLTSQLFPGFAAVEQYGEAGTVGTWTDVYSFAATIYRTLVGNPPPEATERLENDNMTIPAKIARETPKAVLETLANALQVLPNDRTRYIDDMRRGLSVSSAQSASQGAVVSRMEDRSGDSNDSRVRSGKKKRGAGKMYGLVAGIVTAFLLAIIIVFVLWMMEIIGAGGEEESTVSNNKSDFSFDIPSQNSKNEIDFNDETKVEVPKFTSLKYADIALNNEFNGVFKFKIVSKVYSDTYEAGDIISQSPAEGEIVDKDITVEVVVSLGPYFKSMIDVRGYDPDRATFELLKMGFAYENIKIEEKYDENASPNVVISTDPEPGISVNTDTVVTIVVNTYRGTPVDDDDIGDIIV